MGAQAGMVRAPLLSSGGPLGPAEKRKAQGDDGCTHEQGKDGVGGDDVPDNADAGGDNGAGFGEQAGGGDTSSLGKSLLYVFMPCGWLRELDSNQRLRGENPTN